MSDRMTNEIDAWMVDRASHIRSKTVLSTYQRAVLLTPLILVLREEGGFSLSQIAEMLNVSDATVRRYLKAFYGDPA